MTFTLNEFEIETAQLRAAEDFHRPNLQRAVLTLARLMEWTNDNSDGWAYWSKPVNASTRLQNAIYGRYFGSMQFREDFPDISSAEYKAALTPIRKFLTLQGIDHVDIIPS